MFYANHSDHVVRSLHTKHTYNLIRPKMYMEGNVLLQLAPHDLLYASSYIGRKEMFYLWLYNIGHMEK